MSARRPFHRSAAPADPSVDPVDSIDPVDPVDPVDPDPGDVDVPVVDAELVALGPEEPVDGVPVLAQVRAIGPATPSSLPTRQAAAAAATGFVAGAATLAVIHRLGARRLRPVAARRRGLDVLPIVGSRSFLVDVHLIAKPGE